jgi:hypothetical protein
MGDDNLRAQLGNQFRELVCKTADYKRGFLVHPSEPEDSLPANSGIS